MSVFSSLQVSVQHSSSPQIKQNEVLCDFCGMSTGCLAFVFLTLLSYFAHFCLIACLLACLLAYLLACLLACVSVTEPPTQPTALPYAAVCEGSEHDVPATQETAESIESPPTPPYSPIHQEPEGWGPPVDPTSIEVARRAVEWGWPTQQQREIVRKADEEDERERAEKERLSKRVPHPSEPQSPKEPAENDEDVFGDYGYAVSMDEMHRLVQQEVRVTGKKEPEHEEAAAAAAAEAPKREASEPAPAKSKRKASDALKKLHNDE